MVFYGPWQEGRIHEEIVRNDPTVTDSREAIVVSALPYQHSGWYFEAMPGSSYFDHGILNGWRQDSASTINAGDSAYLYGQPTMSQQEFAKTMAEPLGLLGDTAAPAEAQLHWEGSLGHQAQFGFLGHSERWWVRLGTYRFGYRQKLQAYNFYPDPSTWPEGAIGVESEEPGALPQILSATVLPWTTAAESTGSDPTFQLFMKDIGQDASNWMDHANGGYPWSSVEQMRTYKSLGSAGSGTTHEFDVAAMQALMEAASYQQLASVERSPDWAYFSILWTGGWPGTWGTGQQTWYGGYPDLQVRVRHRTPRYRFEYTVEPEPEVPPEPVIVGRPDLVRRRFVG